MRKHLVAAALGLIVAAGIAAAPSPAPVRIGALFPLQGSMAVMAQDEYQGVLAAANLVNAQGGINGHPIQIDAREVDTPGAVATAVASLKSDGVSTVIGTYSSDLSIAASAAAAADGLTYWEAGAVADQVTGRGLPQVFRIGASGHNLGGNSIDFAARTIAPRLGVAPSQLRVAVVYETDAYGTSVAQAALAEAKSSGLDVVDVTTYDSHLPVWDPVFSALSGAHAQVIVLVSHILDGVDFRRQMLARGLHADALIGSSMAECGPDFGALLGPDAIGVFASDRPGDGFDPSRLLPAAQQTYARFAAAWKPAHAGYAPNEEALAGFSAAWALFHDVLPRAASMSAGGVAAAARSLQLPTGSLPNGAGIDFSSDPQTLGQNLAAASVIWQWQGVRHSVVVWPPYYATGTPDDIPLSR